MLSTKPSDAGRSIKPARQSLQPRRRRPRLMALGDLVLDIVVRADVDLLAGSDVPGTISFRAGGSAANTCRVFAALGGQATFVGAVGDDGWGRRLTAALRRDGVRPRLMVVPAPTARLAVLVDPRGQRSFITQRGAADDLTARSLDARWFKGLDLLHLPAYSLIAEPLATAARAAIGHARRADALVSLDLASRGPLLSGGRPAAWRRLAEVGPDMLLGNLDEAQALVGRRSLERLLELAPIVVVKEGSAGCRVMWRRGEHPSQGVLELDVATRSMTASDTTGAGDAFDAGFLHSLAEQLLAEGGMAAATAESRLPVAMRRAQTLRRAAVAGHRAAARLLSQPRKELSA